MENGAVFYRLPISAFIQRGFKPEAVKEVTIAEPKKIQCNTHSRFKRSCPTCVEAAK